MLDVFKYVLLIGLIGGGSYSGIAILDSHDFQFDNFDPAKVQAYVDEHMEYISRQLDNADEKVEIVVESMRIFIEGVKGVMDGKS